MNNNIDYGKTFEYKSYHEGKVKSVTKGLTHSVKIQDKYDAQSKLLEFYSLLDEGKAQQLEFTIFTDDKNNPKRMEITMITEKSRIA